MPERRDKANETIVSATKSMERFKGHLASLNGAHGELTDAIYQQLEQSLEPTDEA